MPPSRNTEDKVAERGLRLVEDIVYLVVSLLLVLGAVLLLAEAGYELFSHLDEGIEEAVKTSLGTLLLVFILVELLSAVKTTVQERKLIAEPFLLVGIIASIKEIVLIASEAEFERPARQFNQAMIEIGVLGGVVLALAGAILLLRRKEREPSE